MSTYREITSMIMDEVKTISDDSQFTEDHILFLLDKYRAFLLRVMQGATVESGGDEIVCKCKYCGRTFKLEGLTFTEPRTEDSITVEFKMVEE